MKNPINYLLLLLFSAFNLWGQSGFINTFTECYYSYDTNNSNSDKSEHLFDCFIAAHDQIQVFGSRKNETLFTTQPSNDIISFAEFDKAGNVTTAKGFEINNQHSRQISNIVHKNFDLAACGSNNWILTTSVNNGQKDVVGYALSNNSQNIIDIINFTEQLNQNIEFSDFIINSNGQLIWIGVMPHTGNLQLGAYHNDCSNWLRREYSFHPIALPNGDHTVPKSIIQLHTPFMGAEYAITGSIGSNVFCLLLDNQLNPVFNGLNIYDIDSSPETKEIGVKLIQRLDGNIAIVGNRKKVVNNFPFPPLDYDEYFFILELDQNMNRANNHLYDIPDVCEEIKDFEINIEGDYIIVGNDSYNCSTLTSLSSPVSGYGFMARINRSGNTVWAKRFTESNSVTGTSFKNVEIVHDTHSDAVEQFVAVGSCWMSVLESTFPFDSYSTNFDNYIIKTSIEGELLDDNTCNEDIDIPPTYVNSTRYLGDVNVEDLLEEHVSLPPLEKDLLIEPEFCDFHHDCCEGTFNEFNAVFLSGATVVPFGCDGVLASLNDVGDCWQVTWDWGDGTTSGPMPATTASISHVYSDNKCADDYTVTWLVEEIDANGNTCYSNTSGTSILSKGSELVTNGDFSSPYTLVPVQGILNFAPVTCSSLPPSSRPSSLWGTYEVHTNASAMACNNEWCAIGQGVNNRFLAADGENGANLPITVGQLRLLWRQIVNVNPNSTYSLCFDTRNLQDPLLVLPNAIYWNPTVMASINGNTAVPITTLAQSACSNWTTLSGSWDSQNSAIADIRIFVMDIAGTTGNDIAIDNISLKQCLGGSGGDAVSGPSSEGNDDSILESLNIEMIESPSLQSSFKANVFPNPFSEQINITLLDSEGESQVTVYDLNGRLITKTVMHSQSHTIDTSELPQGLYLIRITNTLGNKEFKIVKN
ncbi:MAG: T9SS type A sorting domain-containing protein [Chitinophagales bacterium]|nr:T9SS type A sorting domain-containing protein [Chitinophagales bacterium]